MNKENLTKESARDIFKIDGVNINECEYSYTDRYNDICCKASIGGDGPCKPAENICFKYVEALQEQLKHKDLEIEKYKDLALHNGKVCNERLDKIDELEHKVNKMEKGYIELTEIVAPYIDDFTGYNEEQCGFDIVLCVRELMQQLDQLKEEVEKQRALKQAYLACYKTKHGDVKGKLFKYERYKEVLQNIKKIIEVNKVELEECLAHDIDNQILQKISECEVENDR